MTDAFRGSLERVPSVLALAGERWRCFSFAVTVRTREETVKRTVDLWVNFPSAVLRESGPAGPRSEIRVKGGTFVQIDHSRRQCLVRSTDNPGARFEDVFAEFAGPAAPIYRRRMDNERWRVRRVRAGLQYRPTSPDAGLRRVLIDPETELPIEVETDELRVRWKKVTDATSDSPPAPPDVSQWRLEHYDFRSERLAARGPDSIGALSIVRRFSFRTSSMEEPARYALWRSELGAEIAIVAGAIPEGVQPAPGRAELVSIGDARVLVSAGDAASLALGVEAMRGDVRRSVGLTEPDMNGWLNEVVQVVAGT